MYQYLFERLFSRSSVERSLRSQFADTSPQGNISVNRWRLLRGLPQLPLEADNSGQKARWPTSIRAGGKDIPIFTSALEDCLTREVDLGDFEATQPSASSEMAIRSFAGAEKDFPEVIRFIGEWLTQVRWIQPKAGRNSLSSVSYFQLPSYCFLTDAATRFIPPHTVFSNAHVYALLENLFHEGLHQALYGSMDIDKLVASAYEDRPSVSIPWHAGTLWPIEKVFHAWLVYMDITKLRSLVIANGKWPESSRIIEAAELSRGCADYLQRQLLMHKAVLGPLANALLK